MVLYLAKQKDIEFGKDYTTKLYDLKFNLYYKCGEKENGEDNCPLNEDEKSDEVNLYSIVFNYSGFKIDHQNKESPIKKEYVQNIYSCELGETFSFDVLRWKTINYTEEIGFLEKLFGNTVNIFYGGEFLDPQVYTITPDPNIIIENKGNRKIKYLCFFEIDKNTPENYFDNYNRQKKDIFKSIANICSLSLTAYNILIFIYCGYYSNNFDNYQIIQKIIIKNEELIMEKKKEDKNNSINKYYDNKEKKELLLELSDSNNFNEVENNDNKVKKEEVYQNDFCEKNNEEENILPKLHFYDFFFNNIYSKKCCETKKQEIISKCNEIVLKYNSIDYILYNQIKLENLFKDYKWNNPELNNIENNKLINDLKLIT